MKYLIAYLATALTFGVLDAAWLSFAAKRLYRPILGDLLAAKVSLAPAAAFYLIYVFGIVALAIGPALKGGSVGRAALAGAVLGLVAYATYDLTNQATLKMWSTKITLIDLGWGVFATTVAATVGFIAAQRFGGPA